MRMVLRWNRRVTGPRGASTAVTLFVQNTDAYTALRNHLSKPGRVVLGPALQLAAGFFFVYGGSFQSYWYDMWGPSGVGGWWLPQSARVAGWASRLGAK